MCTLATQTSSCETSKNVQHVGGLLETHRCNSAINSHNTEQIIQSRGHSEHSVVIELLKEGCPDNSSRKRESKQRECEPEIKCGITYGTHQIFFMSIGFQRLGVFEGTWRSRRAAGTTVLSIWEQAK